MSIFHEDIRKTLLEMENFLLYSITTTTLPPAAQNKRDLILSQLEKIREKYTILSPRETDDEKVSVSGGTADDISNGSFGVDEVDESYGDVETPIAACDLFNATKASMLMKRGKPGTLRAGSYQKRWCVLKGNIFYYYCKQSDKKQAGAFSVSGYEFRDAPFLIDKDRELSKRELSFELIRPGHRVFQFLALSSEDYAQWKEAIAKASTIPEKMPPQPSPGPPRSDVPAKDTIVNADEEIYDEIAEKMKEPPAVARPMSEEIYDDIAVRPTSMELYDDCLVQAPATHAKSISDVPPPLPPSRSECEYFGKRDQLPEIPSRKAKALPDELPAVPYDQEVYDDVANTAVIFPDFSLWRLADKTDYGNMFYGKWDYQSGRSDEMSFKRGDILHVLSKEYESQGWWIAELDYKVGLVPKVFLTEAYQLID